MYTEQKFHIPTLVGISNQNIEEHLKLYAGYVKNSNLVLEKINSYQGDTSKAYELGELYRHFSFEFNGMRNHECYFALLSEGTQALEQTSALYLKIVEQWGSFEKYLENHKALATNTRGIGWAMLSFDPQAQTLILHWVDEQHLGQLQQTIPLVALDMWEHSYVSDYQPSGKKQYIEDFFQNLNWKQAQAFYDKALK